MTKFNTISILIVTLLVASNMSYINSLRMLKNGEKATEEPSHKYYDEKNADFDAYKEKIGENEKNATISSLKRKISKLDRRIKNVSFRLATNEETLGHYKDLLNDEKVKKDKEQLAKFEQLVNKYIYLTANSKTLLDYLKKQLEEAKAECGDACNKKKDDEKKDDEKKDDEKKDDEKKDDEKKDDEKKDDEKKDDEKNFVTKHGRLRVVNGKLLDKNGEVFQNHGMSLFWSQWMPQFYNKSAVDWMVKDWKLKMIRVSMAANHGGYLTNPAKEKAKVIAVVDAAIANDIYAIIDWHIEGENTQNVEQAKKFYSEMAEKYGKFPHVMYEPWNEPIHTSWPNLKAYHESIISVIRPHSKNLIILGTPKWSQDVDVASRDMPKDENLALSLHFYSHNHKGSHRSKALEAIKNGATLFVTEWGLCHYDGSKVFDLDNTKAWFDLLDEHKISSVNWSISDKDEGCAAITPGASGTGNWAAKDLTVYGKWMKAFISEGKFTEDPNGNDGEGNDDDSDKKDESKGCCSWWANQCSNSSPWCDGSKDRCENHCSGKWVEN